MFTFDRPRGLAPLIAVALAACRSPAPAAPTDPDGIAESQQALTTTIVAKGSTWKYLVTGTAAPANWKDIGFSDAAWPEGPGKLGYGDPDVKTTLGYGGVASAKYPTTYFRKTVTITDPAAFASLTLNLQRDDGAVVYVNGVERFRSNMPAGAISYESFATATTAGADETTYLAKALASANFVAGVNVIAVEVHQADASSTDMGFDLELLGGDGVVLLRGPYLQQGAPTAAVVKWRTDLSTVGKVRFGTAIGTLDKSATESAAGTDHEVAITGLSPATKYFYAIDAGAAQLSGGDANTFFMTAPPPGVAHPTRVWVLGDAGTANAALEGVRGVYATETGSKYTDLWLLLGDNAYTDGTDAEYQKSVFDVHKDLLRQTFLWPAIGNHDTNQSSAPPDSIPFLKIFSLPSKGEVGGLSSGSEKYYSFDHANIHFVCLDSMTAALRAPGSGMLTWLQADLTANTRDWLVVYFHHPPYSKGSHDSDTAKEQMDMRANVLPILESHGVDLVLSGHSHSYERSYLLDGHYGASSTLTAAMKKDSGNGRVGGTGAYVKATKGPAAHEGAVYVVAGSGSAVGTGSLNHPAMFVSLKRYGSLVLDINGNALDGRFLMDVNTTPGDTFRIQKGQAPAPGNIAPTATVASDAATYAAPATVLVTATATDADGTVAKVEFFQGNVLIGTDTTAPFAATWTGVTAGTYSLTAKATDDKGATASSAPLNITVTSANQPPVVTLASDKPSYTAPATVILTATATDVDGTVSRVEFFQGTSLIFTDATAPFQFTWTNVYAGAYSVWARAVDDDGASTDTAMLPINVVLQAPPAPIGLAATSPVAGQVLLTWTDTGGTEDGTKIERSTDGINFTQVGTVPANVVDYSNTGVAVATSYSYRVKAFNAAGDSPPSLVVVIMTATTCVTKPEICNNLDDDCNGTIDDVAATACGLAVGECKQGTSACADDGMGGKKMVCANEKPPIKELCDGKDNDCDGRTDEDYGVGTVCGPTPIGECKQGLIQCMGQGAAVCVGSVDAVLEICGDGKDNNCSGVVDENCANVPRDAGADVPPGAVIMPITDGSTDRRPVPPVDTGASQPRDSAFTVDRSTDNPSAMLVNRGPDLGQVRTDGGSITRPSSDMTGAVDAGAAHDADAGTHPAAKSSGCGCRVGAQRQSVPGGLSFALGVVALGLIAGRRPRSRRR